MIDRITGTLLAKEPMAVTVGVGGIGFQVAISLHSFDELPAVGENVTMLTFLHVREDALQLFGFLREEERHMFRLLLGISGIGPKMALNILSGCGAGDLRSYVATGNVGALTAIPGVGRKTAERIVVELKSIVGKSAEWQPGEQGGSPDRRNEAVLALSALGYNRQIAEKAVSKAVASLSGDASVSDLIKAALKIASG
jgi:Holliday junction DNA helicase RuvA